MSNHFNAKAFESIEKIKDALMAAREQLPMPIVRCGHLLHRAIDDFTVACSFCKHVDIEMAEYDFRRCKRRLKTAIELLTAASQQLTDEDTVPTIDEWCDDDDVDLQRECLQHYCD